MATIHPFFAITPAPGREPEVSSVPYDVVSREEAAAIGKAHPSSFLHVLRPEIDLDDSLDAHAPEAYQASSRALDALVNAGEMVRTGTDGLWLYRLETDGRSQTGIVCCCDIGEYDSGVIKRHELTRPDKEDDRVRHIETLGCHTGPVLVTFRSNSVVAGCYADADREPPIWDFTVDGVRHTGFRIASPDRWVEALASIDALFIADGHHRAAAASRVAASCKIAESRRFLAVLFPHDQLTILAYNRHITLGSDETKRVVGSIESSFTVCDHHSGVPEHPRELCYSTESGKWRALTLPPPDADDPVSRLDLSVFGREILEPIVGITDQRKDPRIDFVGGVDSVSVLGSRIKTEGGIAFSFHPVTCEELLSVAGAGLLMPPKSTWFAPKLRSGLFVHPFR